MNRLPSDTLINGDKILTYPRQKAYERLYENINMSSQADDNLCVQLFEIYPKTYQYIVADFIIYGKRAIQSGLNVSIGFRVDNDTNSPKISVTCNQYHPLYQYCEFYYKKLQNNVYGIYFRQKVGYQYTTIKLVNSTGYITFNPIDSKPFKLDDSYTKINITPSIQYKGDSLVFETSSSKVSIVEKHELNSKVLTTNLIIDVIEQTTAYEFLGIYKGVQVTTDLYTQFVKTDGTTVPCHVKANTNGVVFSTGSAVLPVGKYSVNISCIIK